jgi:molecular chaperone DnaJ
MKDYYQILGISRNASDKDIKQAFHRLAHKYHPDKGGDEKKFKEINEAYQILSNKDKKAQYDNFGRVFDDSQSGQGNSGQGFDFNWFWNSQRNKNQQAEFDFEDLGDIFGDFFSFGNRGPQKKNIKRGRDIRIDIEVPLEETLEGSTKEISINKFVKCSRCDGKGAEPGTPLNECFSCRGTGQVQQVKRTFLGSFTHWTVCPECGGEGYKPKKPCNVCKGEGRIKENEKIKIVIPAGIDSNQMIKIRNKGEAGRKGGQAGDLYVRILVKEHPNFIRKGDDLYTYIEVTFSQASLGDEIKIETLEKEKLSLKIPEGMQSGKILKISNKGIPHFSGNGRGNLYIELIIKTPKKLSKKQKELLRELKEQGL